jgi:Sulfotransferase family
VSLFIQGMRRSGTTILFDALLEDPELTGFYEPLREQDVTVGGGSGARADDAFARTRELRERFARERYPRVPIDEFNWGGPRDAALELEPDLPPHVRDFLASLAERGPGVVIKETRLYAKLAAVAEVDPDARLVHLVRDPRSVVTSTMLGRGRRHSERYPSADDFFEARTKRKLWSSRALSEEIFKDSESGVERWRRAPDFARVLAVWGYAFDHTRRGAERAFGSRHALLRHEELAADPGEALARVYALIGRPLPGAVSEWAGVNVRPPAEIPFGDDPRWGEAIERLGISEAVSAAGYGRPAGTGAA